MTTMTMMVNLNKAKRFTAVGLRVFTSFKNPQSAMQKRKAESGMSLLAVMAVMTIFAIALLAVAPSVQLEVQREKELEAIRRGEEVAEAIRQYVNFYQGSKLPNSIDDLLEGLPQGTKKRQILRASAAIDPLSQDGKWQLVPINKMKNFALRVREYNNDALPSSSGLHPNIINQLGVIITNIDLRSEDDTVAPGEETDEETFSTDNQPFIGVVSQSNSKSVISYYGIENHSKWIFTPLFRGSGFTQFSGGNNPVPPNPSR